jgi:hypothetical protein
VNKESLDQTPTPNGVASLQKDVFPPGSVLTVFFRLHTCRTPHDSKTSHSRARKKRVHGKPRSL